MKIDKHIGYRELGEAARRSDSPNDEIKAALRRYYRTTADESGPPTGGVQPEVANTGDGAASRGRAHALLSNPLLITALVQEVIGAYRGRVTPRDYFTARRILTQALMTKHVITGASLALVVAQPPEQELLIATLHALLCAAGAAHWEPEVFSIDKFNSLTPRNDELARLVGESVFEQIAVASTAASSKAKLEVVTVVDAVRAACMMIAKALATAQQKTYLAQRFFKLVAHIRTEGEPRLDVSAFEDMLSAVNFVDGTLAVETPPTLEALQISSHAPGIFKDLRAHPDVVVRSSQEFLAMYTLQRVRTGRTALPAATILTRNYRAASKPVEVVLLTDLTQASYAGRESYIPAGAMVTPADLPQGVGQVDRLLSTISSYLGELRGMVTPTLEEANPARVLVAFTSEDEIQTIACMVAQDVVYLGSPDTNSLERTYTFRVEAGLEGYQQVMKQRTDGLVQTQKARDVLKFCDTWSGSGSYPSRRKALSGLSGATAYYTTLPSQDGVVNGADTAKCDIVYPTYELAPGGLLPGPNNRETAVKISLHSLLGLRPIDEHLLVIDQGIIDAMRQDIDLISWWHILTTGQEVKPRTYWTHPIIDAEKMPLWGQKGTLTPEAHRAMGRSQAEVTLVDATIALVTSDTLRSVYAEITEQVDVPIGFTHPRTVAEADALIETAQGIIGTVIPELLGLPDGFSRLVNQVFRSDPLARQFQGLCRLRLRKGKGAVSARLEPPRG